MIAVQVLFKCFLGVMQLCYSSFFKLYSRVVHWLFELYKSVIKVFLVDNSDAIKKTFGFSFRLLLRIPGSAWIFKETI